MKIKHVSPGGRSWTLIDMNIKIIKSFSDPEYAQQVGCMNWYWGLGDDGNIYRRLHEQDNWNYIGDLYLRTNLRDMKLIVKEFGHLLVWL